MFNLLSTMKGTGPLAVFALWWSAKTYLDLESSWRLQLWLLYLTRFAIAERHGAMQPVSVRWKG